MDSIDKHIETDIKILEDPTISSQSRRHTQEELHSLKVYKENHPGENHDPTPLELFCDVNPGAMECKSFDV